MSSENSYLVVVRCGQHENNTIASVQYNKYGAQTNVPIIRCNTWEEGFDAAHNTNYNNVLFIDSGTVFVDWNKWIAQMQEYPHSGMVAHIVYGPEHSYPTIDSQAFLLDLKKFPITVLEYSENNVASVVASKKHIHDNYTPLWIKPGNTLTQKQPESFLDKLVAFQLTENRSAIVNWHQTIRDNKIYLYNTKHHYYQNLWANHLDEYNSIAENQLWILNNEPMPQTKPSGRVLTPGSGLFWILCAANPEVKSLTVCDISKTQVLFCNKLWREWDGENYGKFVAQFVKENNIKHFQIDDPDPDPKLKVQLLNSKYLESYVNEKFQLILQQQGIPDFRPAWQHSKQKKVLFLNQSLLDQDLQIYDKVWCSNILSYKWTMLKHDIDKTESFKNLVECKRIL